MRRGSLKRAFCGVKSAAGRAHVEEVAPLGRGNEREEKREGGGDG